MAAQRPSEKHGCLAGRGAGLWSSESQHTNEELSEGLEVWPLQAVVLATDNIIHSHTHIYTHIHTHVHTCTQTHTRTCTHTQINRQNMYKWKRKAVTFISYLTSSLCSAVSLNECANISKQSSFFPRALYMSAFHKHNFTVLNVRSGCVSNKTVHKQRTSLLRLPQPNIH